MSGFDDDMTRCVDEQLLLSGGGAPQDEHHRSGFVVDHRDHPIRETFPPATLMRGCSSGSNRERGVEQQDSGGRPLLERAATRHGASKIGVQFLEDVAQGRRVGDTRANREAQTVGLSGTVIRILAENHDLDLGERSQVQGGEDMCWIRVHGTEPTLVGDECLQVLPVRFGQFRSQDRIPVGHRHRTIVPDRFDAGSARDREVDPCLHRSPKDPSE